MIDDRPTDIGSIVPADEDQSVREQAIKQIERKRHFWYQTVVGTLGLMLLVGIWAISEYHNAGGWPSGGFSQSSGIHDVWNMWIVYPVFGWLFLTAAHAWSVYFRKPISENEIKREIDRQTGEPR